MPMVERDVMLRTIDWQWMEYLTQMEHFREGIGLRAYGQRDPLVEYKNEAFEMFNELREQNPGVDRRRTSSGCRCSGTRRRHLLRRSSARSPRAGLARPMGPTEREGQPRSSGARPAVGAAVVPAGAEMAAGCIRHQDRPQRSLLVRSGKKYKRCHGR